MNYTVRKYKNIDYEFIYNTKKVVYKNYVEINYGKWDEEAQRQMYKNYIAEYANDINIIVIDGKNAGFYHYEILEDKVELGNICIAPEFQGKGLGTTIINQILNENKHKNIYLKVFKQNPAIRLYKRLGFENCEELEHHFKMVIKAKEVEKDI